MTNGGEFRGVTGKLEITFALPTDDPRTWRLKNGTLTFSNGATVSIDVEGGYIPHWKGSQGLTVTYCALRSPLKTAEGRATGDIAMYTCVNGKVIDAVDVADDVELNVPPDWAAALANKNPILAGQPLTASM